MMNRRTILATTAALAAPAVLRAQEGPIRIGLLSDVGGPYRDVGGPGSKVAAELAVEDHGGAVLGRPVQVLQIDDQNKADIAATQARQWVDEGVTALADGAGSSAALAIQDIARERRRIFLMTTPTSTVFIGKQCSPYGFQFAANSYALGKGVGGELSRVGGDTWFFITVDYEMGTSLQSNTEPFIKAAGGRVLGTARTPLGTNDYSAALLQARASGAKVIGLAIAGADLQNCIKQAHEFGIVQKGQRLATLLMMISDVLALGQDTCQGLVLTNSFYWAQTPETEAWTARYVRRMNKPPTEFNAASYAAVNHWLKAVKAAGTTDADAVAARMRELPVDDFYNKGVRIQDNGCVPHAMYLWEVRPAAPGDKPWDIYKRISTIPSPDAYPPPALFGCPLVRS